MNPWLQDIGFTQGLVSFAIRFSQHFLVEKKHVLFPTEEECQICAISLASSDSVYLDPRKSNPDVFLRYCQRCDDVAHDAQPVINIHSLVGK